MRAREGMRASHRRRPPKCNDPSERRASPLLFRFKRGNSWRPLAPTSLLVRAIRRARSTSQVPRPDSPGYIEQCAGWSCQVRGGVGCQQLEQRSASDVDGAVDSPVEITAWSMELELALFVVVLPRRGCAMHRMTPVRVGVDGPLWVPQEFALLDSAGRCDWGKGGWL